MVVPAALRWISAALQSPARSHCVSPGPPPLRSGGKRAERDSRQIGMRRWQGGVQGELMGAVKGQDENQGASEGASVDFISS